MKSSHFSPELFRLSACSKGIFASLLFFSQSALATPYIEAGTSLGRMTGASEFFKDASAQNTGSGFVGSLALYYPVTDDRKFFHFDLGLQNRLNLNTTTSGSSLAMASINLATRLEFSRFFAGAGYSPFDFVSKSAGGGATSLHIYPGAHSYFFEGGVIWRVIPELQICAVYGMEFGQVSGSLSPRPASEYGLRFRFPLNPQEGAGRRSVKFDGFRYPFGFMK